MEQITFVTSNPAKAEQLSQHLNYSITHKKLDLTEIQSLSLEEIAVAKAKSAYAILKTPVLVEDTALTFKALGGLPGPLIKWFLLSLGNEGLTTLLNSDQDRSALAEVCFVYCDGEGVKVFNGQVEGAIANEPRGENGFGWDPIFIPSGSNKTWGEMDAAEQSDTSMRKIALAKLQSYLETQK